MVSYLRRETIFAFPIALQNFLFILVLLLNAILLKCKTENSNSLSILEGPNR